MSGTSFPYLVKSPKKNYRRPGPMLPLLLVQKTPPRTSPVCVVCVIDYNLRA